MRLLALDLANKTITCRVCGRAIHKPPSRMKSKRHYCSAECQRGDRRSESNPNWRGGGTATTCRWCGHSFTYFGKKPQKTCSRECRAKAATVTHDTSDVCALFSRFVDSGLPLYQFTSVCGKSESWLRRQWTLHCPDSFEAYMERKRLSWDDVYNKGRRFEYAVRRDLQKRGYVCMVSPRSLGPADLMAAKSGVVLLVQCKHAGRIRREERVALYKLCAIAGAIPVVACSGAGNQVRYSKLKTDAKHARLEEVSP